jgi:hypothetical protein
MKVGKDERINNIKEYSEDKIIENLESEFRILYIISIVLLIFSILLTLIFFNAVLKYIAAIIISFLNVTTVILQIMKIRNEKIKIKEEIRKIIEIYKIKKLEIEKYEKLVDMEIIKNHNPYFEKFLEILDKNKILRVDELERQLIQDLEKIIFIVESGESSPKGKTYFSEFMEERFKEIVGSPVEIYKINITGTSSFLIFYDDKKKSFDIDNLRSKIYKEYIDYIEFRVQKEIKESDNEEEKEKLKNWYEDFKKQVEKGLKPLILILMPYKLSIDDLIKKVVVGKDREKLEELIENKYYEITKREIELNNTGIKFLYLFQAVGFDEDEEISKRFNKLESHIVEKLKRYYGIKNENYFSELLKKKDFVEKFEEILKKEDKDFYNKIKKDVRYEILIELIKYIQIKVFRMSM